MVRQPAAAAAAAYAKKPGPLSVGLHLDLAEWVYRSGEWVPLYSVVNTEDPSAVQAEILRQLGEFQRLVGRNPTHLDSHQHVHRQEPARSIATSLARKLAVPLRELSAGIRYCGDFYGQDGEGETLPNALTVANLRQIFAALPPGTTELGCHPGYDDGLATCYRAERATEVAVLCAPEIRDALQTLDIRLCSFSGMH
jgi:predicted glycoside hydrolase/deacetylase ChbG (UPF0249 family)